MYPTSTIVMQNAVKPHQMGIATGTLNFFRLLGGAIIVAAFGAIVLGSAGEHAGVRTLETLSAGHADFAPAFAGCSSPRRSSSPSRLPALLAVEERPLHGPLRRADQWRSSRMRQRGSDGTCRKLCALAVQVLFTARVPKIMIRKVEQVVWPSLTAGAPGLSLRRPHGCPRTSVAGALIAAAVALAPLRAQEGHCVRSMSGIERPRGASTRRSAVHWSRMAR